MRYRERSPSPTQMGSKSSLPTLPIPSEATKLPPDSNAKLMFFTMLGLNKTREDEKKGKIELILYWILRTLFLICSTASDLTFMISFLICTYDETKVNKVIVDYQLR